MSSKVIKKVYFVGDPQFSSKKPRYRIEENDSEWLTISTSKLIYINDRAIKERAQIYILGDLTELPQDMAPDLLAILFVEAKKAHEAGLTWRVLWGNHDMVDVGPTNNTVLGLLSLSGLIIDFRESKMQETLTLKPSKGEIVNIQIGGTPFGMELPERIDSFNNEKVFWLTHMDVALGSSPYPGAEEPYEIPGIDFIINGHDHHTKELTWKGKTAWLTTGNILRRKRSDRDHKPVFFEWAPGMDVPQPIYLNVEENVFDMTGKIAQTSKKLDGNSSFVQDLRQNILNAQKEQHESSVESFKKEFFEVVDDHEEPLSNNAKQILDLLFQTVEASE